MKRNIWIDYLRSFITVLVVAHHSSLAYTTFAYFDKATYINSTTPVVDSLRWIGFDIFENFNDIFFMSLMFLISGLFVYKGIIKKGIKHFLIDRFKRLGLPFIIAVIFVIPVAYMPSFYLATHETNIFLFIRDYIVHQQWPVGPPWFIWLLLLFNIIAAILPLKFYTTLSALITKLTQKPVVFLTIIFIVFCVAFIPISIEIGQYTWTGFGPFDFQVNRFFLYLLFFLFGVSLGSIDWENYLFTGNKLLNKKWWFWALLCLVSYLIIEWLTFFAPESINPYSSNSSFAWLIFDLFFVASCISSILAFLAIFKLVNTEHTTWNNLSANAYGIYLIHYVFVTWLQFGLMNISISAIFKFVIVFFGALACSWVITNWVRKITVINNLI